MNNWALEINKVKKKYNENRMDKHLKKNSSRPSPSVEMFLTLLLCHFECKS